jgi:hypothetical protein
MSRQRKADGYIRVNWWEEIDQSGAKLERPLFQQALARCEAGETGKIVVGEGDTGPRRPRARPRTRLRWAPSARAEDLCIEPLQFHRFAKSARAGAQHLGARILGLLSIPHR